MLHPFMPFITEELWHALADPAHPRGNDLILAHWPVPDARALDPEAGPEIDRSEEHTSELQSLMRISYAVFCLKKKKHKNTIDINIINNTQVDEPQPRRHT